MECCSQSASKARADGKTEDLPKLPFCVICGFGRMCIAYLFIQHAD
ncbi:MAG: hypothetical protein ACLTH3_09610 [Lachnospira sp.]